MPYRLQQMKSRLRIIQETVARLISEENFNTNRQTIDWSANYGKNFRLVSTPEGEATRIKDGGGQQPGTLSIVTPANGDAWNWPEAPEEARNNFKNNWNDIQKNLEPHKYLQITTGKNVGADEFDNKGNLTSARPSYTLRKPVPGSAATDPNM